MKTNRLPKGTSKEEQYKAHLVKMGAKKLVRNRMHEQLNTGVYIPANLSRNHPDFGMSVQEHMTEKARRASEKSS